MFLFIVYLYCLLSILYSIRKGQLDVRELISLCPLLLPASSSFMRCQPPLHEFADLNQLAQGDQEKVQHYKHFLISYLCEVRASDHANGFRQDVDTALLKLYAELGHEGLLELLGSDNACLLADSTPWLEKHRRLVLIESAALGIADQNAGFIAYIPPATLKCRLYLH